MVGAVNDSVESGTRAKSQAEFGRGMAKRAEDFLYYNYIKAKTHWLYACMNITQ